jgi:steroid 5-alpha reductase family enzyme
MNPWVMIVVALLGMVVVMTVVWLIQRKTNDAGIVDVAWTFGVGGSAAFFATFSDGDPWRRMLVGGLSLAWAVRLGTYILSRTLTLPEDGRYTRLKASWGASAQTKLFGFFQMQALAAVLFAVPMLIACGSKASLGIWDYLAVLIWLVSVVGETIADRQLARFRRLESSRGKVCRVGLWNYSRHPNYFFEWLHWWAYLFFAITAPWGWVTVFAPLTMLYLITQVTGIPPTEAQAIASRGDAYRAYQRTTSSFFPWPPHNEDPES